MEKQRILIGIPMFNCEKQIPRVLMDFSAQTALWTQHELELLVIDNRSNDNSFEIAKEALQKLPFTSHLTKNKVNVGLGGSQKKAFQWAAENNFDLLVVLHGDHQATTSEIDKLLNVSLAQPELAAVLGSRFSLSSKRHGYSQLRIFGNLGLNILYSLLTLKKVVDLGSGLNLFRVKNMDLQRVLHYSNGFTFNMDLLLDIIKNKKRFIFIPITWTEFDQVSNARNFRVGWMALKTLLSWRFGSASQPLFPKEDMGGLRNSFEIIVDRPELL